MDLRKFPASKNLDEQELLSLWWYQPYLFTDDIVSGLAPRFFIKGLDTTIISRSEFPKVFDRYWKLSNRAGRMYQDWAKALCDLSGVNLKETSVFEIACNTGYLLYWLKQQGARHCVGIDRGDLTRQRTILGDITGIHDIDFREGRWSSDSHSLSGLREDETFDLVMCTAFAQHISDPLHLIKELASRTNKALLFHNLVGYFTWGMRIRYVTKAHPPAWGDQFPNNFDTRVSRKLLLWSLKECGFKEIIQLNYSRKWLPWSWYRCFSTLVCLK